MKYIIKNNKTDKYVNVDRTSGGYPYDTEIQFAYVWVDIEEAIGYMVLFKNENWSLYELKYETKLVDITKIKL